MNGFTLMAESYKKLMNEGKIDKETANKEIRIYDFLATCDTDDFCRMVDSSVFNDIIRAFLKMAIDNAEIGDEEKEKVIGQLRWIYKIKTYDGKTEVISKSGFYVPLDHRALGIYFGMLIPDIDKVVAWQENDAPCIPQMYESWDFEVIK